MRIMIEIDTNNVELYRRIIEDLSSSSICPLFLGLNDFDYTCNSDCKGCWKKALKQAEVKE